MFHIKINKQKFLFLVLFILFVMGGFGLGRTQVAQAGTCTPQDNINGVSSYKNVANKDACGKICTDAGYPAENCTRSWSESDSISMTGGTDKVKADTANPSICANISLTNPQSWFNCILLVVLKFMGFILSVAATLFNWIIDPENMRAVMNNEVIYQTWAMVRDTLNIAFILVLLFSAFSTVFQVDKYSYKKLLLTLVLMALLVNFSYPIARFIIDFSNSMMYYLLSGLGLGGTDVFSGIAKGTDLATIISPPNGTSTDTSLLLVSVIFTWIFAITLLIIAGLFVIRTVALALLIIFSSLAFTGSIIPFMSSYASKWWDNLFKYAFFGPVMIFMLSVAVKMMAAIHLTGMKSMQTIAGQQASNPGLIAAMSFFIMPIIILWGGIIFAQSMSLMGAGAVLKAGTGAMKWGAYNFGKSQYDAYTAARKKRKDAIQSGRFMGTVGNKVNKWQDTAIGAIPLVGGSAKKRAENMRRTEAAKAVREKADDLKGAKIEDLSVEVNNTFNATGALDPSKVNKTSAGSAQAFMNKNADDRKTFVEDALQTKGGTKAAGVLNSGFENVLANAPPNIVTAIASVSAGPGPTNPGYQDALRQVTSYINRQSEKVVNEFTK